MKTVSCFSLIARVRKSWFGAFAGSVLGCATLVAQPVADAAKPDAASNKAPEAEDETIVLSPFTVTSDEDSGYVATSTLAGTRLKTKLADVGASLSVLTSEFLADTSVRNVNQLLTYTLGTEAGGPDGNFAGGTAAGAGAEGLQGVGGVRRSPQTATRVRGIAAADLTRDYFLTEIPFDSYNVERVEISRGPNAILFGLGSPAGIVNYGLIKPSFKPRTSFSAEIASFGSYRGTLDTNQVLVPGKLAFRFAGLRSDQQFEQEPTFETDSRGYLSAIYRPFARTTIKADAEFGRINAIRPNSTSPIDNISVWLNSTRPTWDASTANFAQVPSVLFSQQFFWQWATIWDQPNAAAPTGNGVQGRRNAPAPVRQWVGGANIAEIPGNGSYRLQGFTDLSVYDFQKNLLAGNTGGVHTDFNSVGASWEQGLLDGQTGFELAYNRQEYTDENYDPIGAQESYRIWVDANTNYLDGRANPNFGRPYVMATPQKNDAETVRESLRATAFYEIDFEKQFSGGSGKWLGRHVLTGLLDHQEIDQRTINWRMGWIGVGAGNRVNENLNGALNNFRRRVQNLIYLGPSIASAPSVSAVHIDTYPTTPVWQPGAIYPITGWDIQTQAWTTQQVQEYAQPFGGAANRQEIDSSAVVLQSYWLKEHLVTMAGWRRDRSDSYQLSPVPTDLEGSVLLDKLTPPSVPTSTVDAEVWSYSAVAHLPVKLPLSSRVSLHYSQSENFQPVAARTNIFGEAISAPGGESKEYGLTLAMLEDKVNFRLNWYDATVANETSADASNLAWNIVVNQAEFVALNYLYEDKQAGLVTQAQIDAFGLPPEATRKFVSAAFVTLPNGQGQWTYRIPSSASSASNRAAKGFEVDAIVNPTTHWRIALNVGRQETTTTGAAADVARYIAARQDAWKTVYNLPRGPASPPFSAWYEPVVMIPSRTIASQDGRVSPEQRKWRVNLVTNYDFGSSATLLKNVSVGGALRWQDKVAIGYPLVLNSDGQMVSDIAHPHFGPRELNADIWVGYHRRVKNEKIRWGVKLTVRNALRDRALIPISSQPDGTMAQVRVAPPTTWQLANTFEF